MFNIFTDDIIFPYFHHCIRVSDVYTDIESDWNCIVRSSLNIIPQYDCIFIFDYFCMCHCCRAMKPFPVMFDTPNHPHPSPPPHTHTWEKYQIQILKTFHNSVWIKSRHRRLQIMQLIVISQKRIEKIEWIDVTTKIALKML